MNWRLRTRRLSLDQPKIMGILNITPDSFSDGGFFLEPSQALEQAQKLEAEGADLIDVGAESTRPGATELGAETEWSRLAPVLSLLRRRIKIPISVDTRHGEIARRSLEEGAEIINDVSAGADSSLLREVSRVGAGYILMHTRGKPHNMMEKTEYRDVVREVKAELEAALNRVLELGVKPENICLDPGIGFAKTPAQNFELLRRLDSLTSLGFPLMVGVSRKRLLREMLGEDRNLLDTGSAFLSAIAAWKGAKILRVHEVPPTMAALKIFQKMRE